ncbi:hypothetical protein N7508_010068 [Penicillium antarcticum]|uniref:uncharacterized protein n=1 Tax=Penicillium antarcticum TaxID=416450 RepID=UPI0023888105|nr:uncharacterized protein N7508_010068 [Penicillium antarcticum]KAJ5295247.1 hypothetical protein N7508_010068 [Penicillium antarcticum]
MFKALMGSRSSSSTDVRSKSRRKTDNSDAKSTSSRKSSRGDDRDRGLGDLSSYSPSGSRSKRGPSSIAGDSIASSYVTAEPEPIDDSDRYIIERTPKRRDSDRDSKSSRRRDRDRSVSPDRERRRSRRTTEDTLDDDLDRERERDRRERRRTQSGDPYMPPVSTSMPPPPSAPAVQFATDIAAPGFSQFPMQYDTGMPPAGHSPEHEVPYDPHVQQQFPGQFPEGVAQPYLPMNPAGAAADYYGDQGQSVEMQPGVRPAPPSVLPNTQAHLMAASPTANPPPEPSSMGQTGAAAAYFDDDFHVPAQPAKPPTASSSRPPKPSKPSKPSSSSVLPAAAVGAATYGISGMMSHSHNENSSSEVHNSSSYNQPTTQPMANSSQKPTHKPPHSHSFSEGVGLAAAGGAAGYMMGHHHHSSSPEHASQYDFQNYEGSSQAGIPPYAPGYPSHPHNHPHNPNHHNALYAAGAVGYASNATHNPGFYPHGPGALALQERERGPLGRFVDFWRDPEAVGRFEDYTETIGVCKYCFQPGTTSLDAPRKHHYGRRRRHSADRYSSASSSRVSKVSRYQSSEDESRRRKKSKKSSSWLPGMLAGYATKSIFTNKEFDDSYSIRSGRVASSHDEDDRRSYTSRGVVRRSGRSPQRDYNSDGQRPSGHSRRTRSRSRSSSRSERHSFLKEAALGAAVGGAALAVTKSRNRSRSPSSGRNRHRKDSSSSSSFVNLSRPSKKSVAGGIGSFFTSSSENRKKRQSKKRSGFFSFKGGSSSSSLDNDLAFGDGFSKKSSKLKKKDKKGKDVDAALVGLGATANRLAGSSPNGPGRSAGQMYTKSRHPNYASSANDDEWIDESDQSASSVSSALAFGASSVDSSSDSSGRWGWRWGSKKNKKKKDKKSSGANTALAVGAGALGAAAIASARHRDSEPPSSSGSLQQVYPMPTSDPSRFDVAKMSPSVSGGHPALIRPGPIPLQQPQPVTPVSQAVYTTQGGSPGSIPAYSAPAVPPAFAANEFGPHDTQFHDSRDLVFAPEVPQSDVRRPHRRSESFPVFPTQETASNLKRRSTAKDQASVQFNLTEEQAERERRLDRRDQTSRDDLFAPKPLQLLDREDEDRQEAERLDRRRREREEEDRLEMERLERRRKEREAEKRASEKRRETSEREKDSSSWVGVAAAGAFGAAAASTVLSRKTDDDEASEASLRRNELREKRRAERRREGDIDAELSLVSRFEPPLAIEEAPAAEHHEEKKPRSPRQPQVYDDYAQFYAPEELRHSPNDHKRSGSGGMPTIVEIEPASERHARDEPKREEPDYSFEPYEHVDRLPWPVPRLNFIEPTPPQSTNGGSVRDANSPIAAPADTSSYDTKPRERSNTGSRVSWGDDKTHEYEIPSSSEQDPLEHDISPYEEVSPKDVPLPVSDVSSTRNIASKPDYGNDIEFAATIAAATAAAGFDPAMITDDPSYHTRTSPPGSEDEGRFKSPWAASARKPHGFVEGEIEDVGPKTIKDAPASNHITDKDELFFDEPEPFSKDTKDRDISGRHDKSSIAQEVLEQLNGKRDKHDQPTSPERERNVDIDTFSMPGGFDAGDLRDPVDYHDARSAVSAPGPVTQDPESPTQSKKSKSKKQKKSRKSADNVEIETKERGPEPQPERQPEPVSEPVPETVREPEPETIEYQDENRSIVSAPATKDETSKSRRSRRSGDEFDIAPLQDVTESRDDTRSTFSVPATKDETSKSKNSRRSGDDFDIYKSREVPESRELSPPTNAPAPKEHESPRSKPLRRSSENFEIVPFRDVSESRDDRSVFSTPATKDETSKSRRSRRSGDEFDIAVSRDVSESRDDTRSVFSVPATKDETSKPRRSRRSGDDFDISRSREPSESRSVTSESRHRRSRRSGDDYVSRSRDVSESRSVASESSRHRKSRRSGDDFESRRDTETPPLEDGEEGEEKKRRRKRRSRHGSDTFSIDDDARSAITDLADDKSERRKHRHRSSRDFDDTASVTSSPARISESRERRKGKEEEKEKKPGGFLRSIFGSQVSAPAERTRSSSVDKRSSREALSEVVVDDERRRRKKRSSKHRSSSNGDELEDASDKEKDAEEGTNLEDYRSSRQRKEERRRHRYEEIVDSGRKRDSEKDLNDDYDNQSFLNERPETPAAAERDDHDHERGASGLPSAAGTALGAAAGLGLGEMLQQRPRSRSTSPPSTEKALDLTPKSQSRPASPETSRSPNARRGSVAKSVTESPTAVPLHFRRPPTSPGLSRAVPVDAPNLESPGSPSQQRHRRPGSVEFRNSREIRPLWLVERHSSVKGESEPQEGLPSLPSSKTSSRVPSIEDLKALNDDDGVRSWEQVDLSHSIMENRRPTGLTIETDQANEHHDRDREIDLLDSQQATPTAEHFDTTSPSAKREKLKYEFHSPSELLRNPDGFEQLPGGPALEALPPAAPETPQSEYETPAEDVPERGSHSGDGFSKGAGFAGIVDAAAIAAVKDKESQQPAEHAEVSESRALPEDGMENAPAESKIHSFGDIVDAAVATEVASHDKAPVDEEIGEPGTAIEENVPVQFEAEKPVEASREFGQEAAPEATEQPIETEAAMTPAQKRKAKKNKKKNKSQDQSVETAPEETVPIVKEDPFKEVEQEPAVQKPAVRDAPVEVDTTPVEPEAVASSQKDIPEAAQHQAEGEPVEGSREIVAEPEIPPESGVPAPFADQDAAIQQPAEAELVEASQDPAVDSSAAPVETSEPVIAPETEAETEPEVALTAAQKKKAKKDKKKKNKSKDASAEEPADNIASTETPKEEEAVPVEEPISADANETVAPRDSQPEGEELSRSLGDIEKPFEEATPVASEDVTAPAVIEPTKEDTEGEDNFQEAVEEQASQPTEEKEPEVAQESTAELAPEPAAEIPADEPAEAPADPQETKAQKKKNKKKNRKSATDEEIPVPTNEELTPAPEGEIQELKPAEESAPTEPADTQIPETSDEALPSDLEQPAKGLELPSETPTDEPATALQQEQDARPTEATVNATPSPVEVEGPTNETSREIVEPVAIDAQPEVQLEAAAEIVAQPQPEAEAEAEAEAESEVALTAAQKKKAKKDKKKKNKQSQSSVPDKELSDESAPTEPSSLAPEAEPVAEPAVESTTELAAEPAAESAAELPIEDTAKETLEEAPVDLAPQETDKEVTIEIEQPVEPEQSTELGKVVEPEQPQEDAVLTAVPEPTAEETSAETHMDKSVVQEEQAQAEEPPAKPEVPMTAAQRKKAKKEAKKKQEKEAALAAAFETASPAEPAPLPVETEATESSKDLNPSAQNVPAVTDTEPAEANADVISPPEEAPVSADVAQSEKPKLENETSAPAEEATPTAVETETHESEAPAEAEVPMTTAEKKKAKKNKKQQKQPESTPAEEAVPPVEEAKATEEVPLSEPNEAEAVPAAEAETTPQEEQAQDIPAFDKEAPTEAVSDETVIAPEPSEQATDAQDVAQNTVPETIAEQAAPIEDVQEEQKDNVTLEQPTDDKVPIVEETPVLESTEAAAAAAAEEAAMTPAQKRKAKKDKKKNKGLTANPEEEQLTPGEEQSKPTPAEEEAGAAPVEEPTPISAEEPIEPITEPPFADKEVENPVPTEEASFEEASRESIQQDAPADAAETEAAEEAAMTPAQKRKAKKDKKKRQSLAAEEPPATATEEEPKSDPTEEVIEPTPPTESKEPAPAQDVEQPATDREIEDSIVAEEAKSEEPLPENTQNEAPADEAAIQAAEEAAMTPAQKQKAKKDKKKRQSLAVEEQQPAPVEEEVKDTPIEEEPKAVPVEEVIEPTPVESAEPAPSEELEQPAPEKDDVVPVVTEEAPKAEESSPEEPASQDTPADASAVEAAGETAMTPAQKRKAKKDKKKRQSLTAEEQPAPSEQPATTEEETQAAPVEDVSAERAIVQDDEQPAVAEAVEAPVNTEEVTKSEEPTPEESNQQDVPAETATPEAAEEAMTPAQKRKAKKDKKKSRMSVAWENEEPASQADDSKFEQDSTAPEEKNEPQDASAEAAVTSEDATKELPVAEEVAEAATDKDTSVPETGALDEPEKTEEVTPSEEVKEITEQEPSTPVQAEEESKPISEPQSPSRQDDEAQAEAGMTAKERRKAKKNKKKGKSIDLTEDAPVETEAVPDTPADTTADPTPAPEEKLVEADNPKIEKLAPIEPATEDVPKEEKTDEPPATETAAEPAEEAAMTPAQKRKAKKAKKRQSKNADADNDASSAPGTPAEPADSVEKVLASMETPGLSAVTATSPAEHDGKENQSHDIETAAAQDLASTDEFMSSQVEQPQIESPFLGYPPQPVLERSVNSGELEEVLAPEQGDDTPAIQEPELLTKEGDLEVGGQKEDGEKPQEELIEPAPSAEEMTSVPEAGDLSGEKTIEETSVDVTEKVGLEAQTEEAPVEEKTLETALSKKQKKQNKKNKTKQAENVVEEKGPAPEPESAVAEEKEQHEAVSLPEVESVPEPEKTITEPEPAAEIETVPALEDQAFDQPKEIEEPSAVQTIEAAEATLEPTVPEAEPVAPASEEPESASATKLSKKDKKKQRQLLLAQQAGSEQQPEEEPAPEATEAAVPEAEIPIDAAALDEKPGDEPVARAEKATAQPADVTEEAVKDVEKPAQEAEKPLLTQEPESGERSIELPSDDVKMEEIVEEPATETATENFDAEQLTEQAPAEPAVEAPTSSKKLSKKEKKKAAAAAAAAAALVEEENSAKELPAAEEPSTSVPHASQEPAEQPTVDEPRPTEAKDEPQFETERSLDETKELAAPKPKENKAAEQQAVEDTQPTESLEPEVAPEQPAKELVEESIAPEPISRKMSKKERKKAKKQEQQEILEPTSPAEESVAAPEPETTEVPPKKETSQESPLQPHPESIPLADKEPLGSEKNYDLVSQDQSNDFEPAEAVAQEQTAFEESTATEDSIQKNVEKHAEAAEPSMQEIDKAADPGDQPVESEVTPALSKKESKKDKRKAKKKGVTEDVSEELQADVAEDPKEIDSQPTKSAFELEAPRELETAADPTPVVERELPIDAPSAAEEQPAPTEPEHVTKDETSLSRKASKKKSKKAKKASQGLDLEPQAEVQNETEQAVIAPFEEDAPKPQDTEIADAPVDKANQEDENWPAIDWEHAKGEHGQQFQDTAPEPESDPVIPSTETIGEFEDSTIPKDLQEPTDAAEDDSWAAPLSKKDKKTKKNKKQSQQADEPEALPEISYDKSIEQTTAESLQETAETTGEIEPPARTTTPGGSKIANLFPRLERGGFKRPKTPSLKDSAEEETEAGASRDIALPVLEAPRPAPEATEFAKDTSGELPSSLQHQIESAISHWTPDEVPSAENEQSKELDFPAQSEKTLDAPFSHPEPTKEPPSPTKSLVSQVAAGEDLSGLRRSPSIHGRHEKTPRTWSLDEPSVPALAPSPPRSLFGPDESYTRPRTPLDTIAEQEPRDGHGSTKGRRGTPRLEIKPEHVLPRPQTPVRKFTDTAFDREQWPTPENESRKGSREDLKREITKTPEQVLKPSTSSGKLRRTNRSASGDLRAASLAGSQPSDLDQLPSSSSYDPVTDKGKRPVRNMSDVYEGWGETPSSPRSPSRPPSVRRRRSMQHLQDIETRLDQLISENRLLIAARDEAEYNLKHSSVARRKSDRALNTRDGDLRDKEAEVEQLKSSVEWLQKETTRLTQENEGLTASNAALAAAHAAEVNTVRESSTRELDDLRSQHTQLSSQVDDRVRQEIESALAQKDIELRRLRTELEETRDKVKELQQQISASVHDNALVFRDEEYFDAACQKLCGHVQSWVLRFSKHNDKRRCRSLSELRDEKIADRFDNALLDGSDPDAYLSDRVRRRDVFMSVIMTMVWEYVFTRYLFGMDREQRQKLKSLEKQLGEVGPSRAVHRWRATTLTLLSRRPAFAAQRESDTEAVTLEIFKTLSKVLPPPSHVESQLLDSLRKIMRVAVNLSLEMRTQLAEFIMLPPLQPEYDTNGDLARQVYFNAALMNERSGLTNDNGELEAQQSVVRIVLFPLVVKKGNDVGEGDDEVVVCPAQVLIARPGKDKRVSRMMSGDRMSIDATKSVHSMAPSSMMDMSNMI